MRRNRKPNPLLIRVNPDNVVDRVDALWAEATAKLPGLTRQEFDAALAQFKRQHGTLPAKLTVEDVQGLSDNVRVLVKVGNVSEIRYEPDDYSRKAPYAYYHETKDESLLTDATGQVLILHGKTRVCNGRKKGWLID